MPKQQAPVVHCVTGTGFEQSGPKMLARRCTPFVAPEEVRAFLRSAPPPHVWFAPHLYPIGAVAQNVAGAVNGPTNVVPLPPLLALKQMFTPGPPPPWRTTVICV